MESVSVTPAQAGVQPAFFLLKNWIPAYAGMTGCVL
jgi:hypothetical protein